MARKGRVDRGLYARPLSDGTLVWYVRLWEGGRRRQFGSFPTKTLARTFYEEAKRSQRLGQFFPEQFQRRQAPLLGEMIAGYLLTQEGKRSLKREKEFGRWWTKQRGTVRAPALTARLLEEDRLALRQGGRSLATINRYTDCLRRIYNWGLKQGFVRENPVRALERYPEEEAATEDYTPEQEQAILEHLTEEERDMIGFAVLSGLRQHEQFSLPKAAVDLDRGLVTIARTKNRKPRILQLSQVEQEILRRQIARHPTSPWLYPGVRRKGVHLDARWFYRVRFRPAVQAAGIPTPKGAQLWHRFRHTFGSRLAELGYQEHQIQKKGAWLSKRAAERYVHARDAKLKEIGDRLATLRPQIGTGTSVATIAEALKSDS